MDSSVFDSNLLSKKFNDFENEDLTAGAYDERKEKISIISDYAMHEHENFRQNRTNFIYKDEVDLIDKSYTAHKRLLWVNKVLLVPVRMPITITTNSYDVIHSWFVPAMGMKLDCVPGRATQHTIYIEYTGYYYGQCAEVCGRRHHHMPIKIRAIPFKWFKYW